MKHPLYSKLNASLARANAELGAAEAHGLLCGLLCACGAITFARWYGEVLAEADPNNVATQEAQALMAQAHLATVAELDKANSISITLMLPDDSDELQTRAQALAQWCQGWLFGFSLGGVSAKGKLPNDSAELMQDFSEIARAGVEEEGDAQEAESALVELEEYVRCGVVLIHAELSDFHQTRQHTQH